MENDNTVFGYKTVNNQGKEFNGAAYFDKTTHRLKAVDLKQYIELKGGILVLPYVGGGFTFYDQRGGFHRVSNYHEARVVFDSLKIN